MLYYVFYEGLQPFLSPLRVFQYITVRTVYAAVIAFIISIALGPWAIRHLRQLKIGQHVRAEGLESHYSKEGTPTMGGVLIIGAWVTSTLLCARFVSPFMAAALLALVWFGGLGFLDDWAKIRRKRSLGLRAWQKIALQTIGAVGVTLLLLKYGDGANVPATALVFPFFKMAQPVLPTWLYVVFAAVVIVGSANAVNLTDGQDGLAITCTTFVVGTLAILSYITSHALIAEYLGIPHIPDAGELTVYCGALAGAGLGFLWWNCYPAEVFMGDTGSMALGGAIGTVAVATKHELLLVVMGGIFVANAVSVILQVAYFRRTGGKRLFRMAPLHHHFEKGGMPEPKVTVRFWIVAAVLLLIAVSTLKLR